MDALRKKVIRLAYRKPQLRPYLLPLVKLAYGDPLGDAATQLLSRHGLDYAAETLFYEDYGPGAMKVTDLSGETVLRVDWDFGSGVKPLSSRYRNLSREKWVKDLVKLIDRSI